MFAEGIPQITYGVSTCDDEHGVMRRLIIASDYGYVNDTGGQRAKTLSDGISHVIHLGRGKCVVEW